MEKPISNMHKSLCLSYDCKDINDSGIINGGEIKIDKKRPYIARESGFKHSKQRRHSSLKSAISDLKTRHNIIL